MEAQIINIIAASAVATVVGLLKKVKLPSHLAPIAAVVIAVLIVAGGQIVGVDLKIDSVLEAIAKAMNIAGISVLGYDIIKKLKEGS